YNDVVMTTGLGSHLSMCVGAGTNEITRCQGATVADLATAVTGTGLQWYAASTGGTALLNTLTLVAGSYFASQTVNGCESSRTEIIVAITPSITSDFASIPAFC